MAHMSSYELAYMDEDGEDGTYTIYAYSEKQASQIADKWLEENNCEYLYLEKSVNHAYKVG